MAQVSPEEKRQAMERVLQSRALRRSEKLRALLRHVCEAELQGKAHEVNEYTLGVVALGRPKDYSPAEDSCVRSRAYELRSKLRTYYEVEAPDDPVRIEIAKGGYVPRFTRVPESPSKDGSFDEARPAAIAPELRALWNPFLESAAPLLIVFEVRMFFYSPATGLVVRDYRCNTPGDVGQSKPLTTFLKRLGEEELRETLDYADFGAVHAAFLLGRLLAGGRRDVVLKHSSSLDWQDIWNSNVVFIGKPSINSMVSSFLEGRPFSDDEGVIRNARPKEGEAAEYGCAATHGMGEKHALITRLRGPRHGRHMLLLCGAGAELTWALAESVTNPEHVAEIMSHLRLPSGQHADTFQVVIRATFQSGVPIKIGYVTHRLLRA
jgi:hypothetical protein